jgi:hypothetical protein
MSAMLMIFVSVACLNAAEDFKEVLFFFLVKLRARNCFNEVTSLSQDQFLSVQHRPFQPCIRSAFPVPASSYPYPDWFFNVNPSSQISTTLGTISSIVKMPPS